MPTPYDDDLILRASEVGHYMFCRRAWWLAQVLGYRPDDQAVLTAGIRFHQRLGRSVSTAQRWEKISYALLGLGLIVGALLILGSCGTVTR